MLDLMELRGFEVVVHLRGHIHLRTPDRFDYVVSRVPLKSDIYSAFQEFQKLNTRYP